jgi:predicted ATPase/DNA-binding CsgD family transcriptional regulator
MSSPLPFEHLPQILTPWSGDRLAGRTLPIPITPLIGRAREVEEARRRLDADETRLLALLGPGGIGKTRLALEIAGSVAGDFAHGVCFVPLASVRDPSNVDSAVAQAFGIRESGDHPLSALLETVLRDQHLLLVLDNLEHVIEGASRWLISLLQACPRLKVLVTSRIALHVSGEQRFLVPPLPVPEYVNVPALDALSGNPSVRLFVQRARAIRPDFLLDESNAETIAGICRNLEGLPLAIELAAARVGVLSPKALLGRLSNQLTLLTGGMSDAPARHQTMRDAIAWSYDLLNPEEQSLFRRLSVIVGGFSLDAVEAMTSAGEIDADSVTSPDARFRQSVDIVTLLIDHSLVRREQAADGETRFTMLETIREYGLDQLTSHDEDQRVRDVHAAYYVWLAAESEQAVKGEEQLIWLARLEDEHDNLRAALGWLTEQERIDDAMELAGSIWFFRWIRGYYSEGRDQLESLLSHPRATARTLSRAKALNAAAITALSQGELDRSGTLHEEAIGIFRELDRTDYVAFALMCLGATSLTSDDLDRATHVATESLELARGLDDGWIVSAAKNILGSISLTKGDVEQGASLMEESVRYSRAVGDRWGMALGLANLGRIAMNEDDYERATPLIEESVDLFRQLGDKRDLPFGLMALSDIARKHGDFETARAYLEDGLNVSRDIGDKLGLGYSLLGLGRLACVQEEWEKAARLLHESLDMLSSVGHQAGLVDCFDELAELAVVKREMNTAARLLGASDAILAALGISRPEGAFADDYRKRKVAARNALGKAAFDAAWSAGKALSQEEAVEAALAFVSSPAGSTSGRVRRMSIQTQRLSRRELEVLQLMADGLTNQDIADRLFLSHRTATSHATNILHKLGLSTRTAAVAYAIRSGLA